MQSLESIWTRSAFLRTLTQIASSEAFILNEIACILRLNGQFQRQQENLINSVGNLGGFVGPYAIGAIDMRTGNFRGGLAFAGISLFTSAMLILALRKRRAQETGAVAMAESSPA